MIFLLFIFFFIISFFAFKIDGFNSRYKKIVFLIIGFLLIIYAAFRDGDSVNDYDVYKMLFDDTDTIIEPTFSFITLVVKKLFFGNILILFIVYAILGVSTKLKAITQLTSLWFLSLLVYLSYFFILHELTQIRAGVASGILLLCIKPMYDRNFKRFLILCIIATMFHYSALIILPLWFINANDTKKAIWLMVIPVGYLIYFLHIDLILVLPLPYIQDKITLYKEWQELGFFKIDKINMFNSLFLLKCAFFYLLMYKYELLKRSNKYSVILLKIYGISLFALPGFSVLPVVAFRINELLGIVEIILFPMIYYLFKPGIYGKVFVFSICLVLVLLSIFYTRYIF